MTIVITGATGHLGRHVVDALLGRGIDPTEIVAAGRSVDKLAALAETGVRTARIDFNDPASLDDAFAGADTVLLVSSSDPSNRVAEHRNAIDAAVRAGVGRIVYTSAPRADTSALVLAPDHKATEELITASGLDFTILRYSWYTENYVKTVADAGESGVISSSTGDGRVASASRVDYAEAAAVVLAEDGHSRAVYELSGDVAWTFADLAATASEILGREVRHVSLTPDEHREALLSAGLDEGTAGFVVALDGNIRDGVLAETTGNLARLIGRKTTPLADGLRSALA
jgi:NAD(P)H dehydrogenase (quinone)